MFDDKEKYPRTLFFRSFGTLVSFVGPIAFAGIAYLGMFVTLSLLFPGAGVLAGVISALIGMACGTLNWGLDVQETWRELREKESEALSHWSKYKAHVIAAYLKGWWSLLKAILPKCRRLVPDFFFKVFYKLFGYPSEEKVKTWDDSDKSWLASLKQKRLVEETLVGPCIKIIAPLALGALMFMGVIPLLHFFGLASSATGGLTPFGLTFALLAVVVAMLESYSLEVHVILQKLRRGVGNGLRALKRLFSKYKPIEYQYHQCHLPYGVKYDQENGDKPLIDKHGNPVKDANGDPVMLAICVGSLRDDQYAIRDVAGIPLLDNSGHEVVDKNGEAIKFLIVDIEGDLKKRQRKGFFQRWLPATVGTVIVFLGPLLWGFTAYLGMGTFFAAMNVVSAWVLPVSIAVCAAATLQNLSLDTDYTLDALTRRGREADILIHDIKQLVRVSGFRAIGRKLLALGRALTPDPLIKLFGGRVMFKVPKSYLIRYGNMPTHLEKNWKVTIIGFLVSIMGTTGYGSESVRSGMPLAAGFLALFGLSISFGLHLAVGTYAFLALAFTVTFIQCASLEVSRTLDTLYEPLIKKWVAKNGKRVAVNFAPLPKYNYRQLPGMKAGITTEDTADDLSSSSSLGYDQNALSLSELEDSYSSASVDVGGCSSAFSYS